MGEREVYYYIFSKEKISLKTNIKNFWWIFGRSGEKTDERGYRDCLIRVSVLSKESSEIGIEKGGVEKFSHYYGRKNSGKILYERGFIFGSRLKFSMEIGERDINIEVNNTYEKFIKYRFMNLHGINLVAADAASVLLLKNGYLPLHCSAFARDSQATVLIAPPKTGKSLTMLNYCREGRIDYLSEDIALTDGEDLYSVPNTGTIGYYRGENSSVSERVKRNILEKLPFMELVIPGRKMEGLDGRPRVDRAPIRNIFLLGQSDREVSQRVEDPGRRIASLESYTLKYLTAPAMIVFEYFNDGFSLGEIRERSREITERMVRGKRVREIKSSNAMKFKDVIERSISEQEGCV